MRTRSIARHAARTCALITLLAASPSTALLGVAGVATGAVLLTPVAAQAQSSQAAARAAQAVTVRIEGATQGSGVLVKREGNRYTVLTAWHVVSAQRPGEELAIYTPDGRSHPLEAGSIRRLGTVDLAVLTFSSGTAYETARIGDRSSVQMGGAIYVSGFPLPSTAVPSRLLRFLDGQVIANAQVAIPNGYQLLYSNPTLPGMSGGPVFNSRGEVVGIHGQGETDAQRSEQSGVAVKTGTNQGVPIAYYTQAMAAASGSAPVAIARATGRTADDYLAEARQLLNVKGKEQEMIRLTTLALAQQQSFLSYYSRAYAKNKLGDYHGAIADLNQAISIDPRDSMAYTARGGAKSKLGDHRGAIADLNQAISINPRYASAYANRGSAKADLSDFQGAIADYDQAQALNQPTNKELAIFIYAKRGMAKSELGNAQGAIEDMIRHADVYNPAGVNQPRSRKLEGLGVGIAQHAAQQLLEDKSDQALPLARLATRLIPNDPRAWVLLAEVQLRSRHFKEASVSLARAKQLDPSNAGIWFAEASLALRDNRANEAIELFNQGFKRDPRNASAYFDLGNAHILLNQPRQALAAFEHSVRLRKDFWEAINNQALVLYEQGEVDRAIERWRRVLEIKADAAEPNLALAAALFQRGAPARQEALQRASQALDSEPNYVLDSYQKEQLWGPRLRADTGSLLTQPELKRAVEQAKTKAQKSEH